MDIAQISTARLDTVPKADIQILNQLIDDDDGMYRVRAGSRVHYLRIPTTVFSESTISRPHLLIPEMPDFPATAWTTMDISRGPDGMLKSTISFEPPSAVREIWHPNSVDVLLLPRMKMYRSSVHEVVYQGRRAISKIACFGWDIQRINHETWVYSILERHHHQHPNTPRIAPKFLAHLTENGRVISMLLEKVDGDFASMDNITGCEAALRDLHRMGMVHGDVNRYNVIVDPVTSHIRMVDFEHAEEIEEEKARAEIASLPNELAEETNRGRACPINL
jgi:hypothetical protein